MLLHRQVRLWNMMNGDELKAFLGHDNAIMSVDYAKNGAHVLTASLDGTLKMWDTSEPGGGPRSSCSTSRATRGSSCPICIYALHVHDCICGGPRSLFDKPSNSWLKVSMCNCGYI